MFFGENALVTSLVCHQVFYTQKNALDVPGRAHHSLSYRFSGQTVLEFGGERLVSVPGTLTYVPKGLDYITEIPEAGEMIVAHFDLMDEDAPAVPMVITPTDPTLFAEEFVSLSHRINRGRDPKSLSIFYGILAALNQDQPSLGNTSPRALAIKEYIDRRLNRSELGVSAVAERFGVSDSYLRRFFRSAFGISPGAYIKKSRIENAKILLQTGYYTIGQVASQCGFESLSYFSAEFHRSVGCSPREYMNKK